MKKLNNTEVELKKSVAYKKWRVLGAWLPVTSVLVIGYTFRLRKRSRRIDIMYNTFQCLQILF